jgi:hypothetical protein
VIKQQDVSEVKAIAVTVTVRRKMTKTKSVQKVRSPDSRLLNGTMKSKERTNVQTSDVKRRVLTDKRGSC